MDEIQVGNSYLFSLNKITILVTGLQFLTLLIFVTSHQVHIQTPRSHVFTEKNVALDNLAPIQQLPSRNGSILFPRAPKIDDFETKIKLKVGARRNIFLQTLLDTRASYISNFCCSKLILKDSKGKIIRPRLPLQVDSFDLCDLSLQELTISLVR